MSRILSNAASVLAAAFSAALALVVAAAVFLFATPPGRRVVADIAASEIGRTLGGKAEIGRLSGAPPSRLVLDDVTLADAHGVFLAGARIEATWRPLALLSGRLVIDKLAVSDAALSRLPTGRDGGGGRFSLPIGLPQIEIGDVTLARIRAPAAERTILLGGGGAVSMGGARVDARLVLQSADSPDRLSLSASVDPRRDRIAVDLVVDGPPGGSIATLADLGGGVAVALHVDGPPAAFRGRMTASLGGALSGGLDLAGAVGERARLDLRGELAPGMRLSAVARAIGPAVSIDATVRATADGYAGELRRLAGAHADARGAIAVAGGRAGITSATLRADVTTLSPRETILPSWLGRNAHIEAAAMRRGAELVGRAVVESAGGRLQFVDLARRRDGAVSGAFELSLRPAAAAPALLRGGLAARGRVVRSADGSLRLEDASGRTPDVAFAGGAVFRPKAADFDLTALLRLSRWSPGADVKLSAHGALSDFSATFEAALPRQGTTPPSRLSGALNGLPGRAAGRLAFARGTATGSAALSADGLKQVRVQNIRLDAPDFNLKGEVSYDIEGRRAVVDLAYTGEEKLRAVASGISLGGGGRVSGVLSLGAEAGDLEVQADRAGVGPITVDGLVLSAKGSAVALDATLDLRRLSVGPARASSVKSAARLDLSAREGTLSQLSARVGDSTARLARPATLNFGERMTLLDFDLAYAAGRITIDAEASARRWRFALDATRLPLASAPDGRLDLAFDLDTDRPSPATGGFRLSAAAPDGPAFAVAGALAWDGRRVSIRDDRANPAAAIDLQLPLALQRTPRVGVKTDGAIAGEARYAGTVDAIADFLPPALQTIEGALTASVRLAGDWARPQATGALALRNGSYTDLSAGVAVVGLSVDATAEPRPFGSIVRVRAVGRGPDQTKDTIRFAGEARLGADASLNGTLSFEGASLSADLVERAVIDGDARLEGPLRRLRLSGALAVREALASLKTPRQTGLQAIEVRATGASAPPAEEAAPEPPLVGFDLKIAAGDRVTLRGRGLDSLWRASLAVGGDSRAPLVTGRLTLARGAFDFSGRRFQLTRGEVGFDSLDPNNPSLDIRGEHRTRDGVLAVIAVGGRARAPEITLTSSPAYPPEDVAALVLFGKRAVELTAAETVQAAQALAQLSGFGGGATRALGLDLLSVDFDSESGAGALSVGKNVARGLFVSARQDARGESGSLRVEYGLSDNFTVETEIRQDGEQTVSANWKRDF